MLANLYVNLDMNAKVESVRRSACWRHPRNTVRKQVQCWQDCNGREI